MGGLVQVLGIKRGTQAEGDTGAEQDVVGQSGNTTVVDLGLFVECRVSYCVLHCPMGLLEMAGEETYLGEGRGVQAVLAGDLEADSVA